MNQPSHIYILESSENLILGEREKFFTPTTEEITLSDSIVCAFLKTNSPYVNEDKTINNYSELFRQYLGIIDSSDRKIIFVNTFCNEDDTVRANKDFVLGFGECYFSLIVFPNEKICVKPSNKTFSEN